MISSRHQLFCDVFDDCYQSVQSKVTVRTASSSYDWLMHDSSHSFYPDYFTLDFVGTNILTRGLNRLTRGFSKFSLFNVVMQRLIGLFYDVYESHYRTLVGIDEEVVYLWNLKMVN